MMDVTFFSTVLLLIFSTFLLLNVEATKNRSKRFLLFPRANPTRNQFVFGVGIPLELPQISVISGYVLRGNYYMPWNIQHYIPMFLKNETVLADEIWTRLNRTDYLRRKREINSLETTLNDFDIQNLDEESTTEELYKEPEQDLKGFGNKDFNSRWTFYDIVIGAIENQGHLGKPCLLRAICEAASVQFTHYSGIIGELLHVVLNPSTSKDTVEKQGHYEYYFAEEAGRHSKPCDQLFKECKISILDLFSGVHETN